MWSIFFALSITLSPIAYGQSHRFSAINIQGLKRTHPSIVLGELYFSKNEDVLAGDLDKALVRIRNTGLFASASFSILPTDNGEKLLIVLEERWTTIPILKVASGGGVNQLTAGVFDPNLLGRRLEMGVQVERLEDTYSAVTWLKKPRILSSRVGLDLQYWNINRLRTKYESGAENPVQKTGFLQKRKKAFAGLNYNLSFLWNIFLFYEYNYDEFSDEFVTDTVKTLLTTTGLPPTSEVHFTGLRLEYGQLRVDRHLIDGTLLKWDYKQGLTSIGANNFWQSDFTALWYKTLFSDSTLAQRLMAGFTTTEILQYWYYLGGLDRVRGFSDNRFSGRYFWLSNSEFRLPFIRKPWLVTQAVAFTDLISTAEHADGLGKLTAASMGLGLRLVLPKIYRSVLRFDYARPIRKSDDMNVSFGVQQFF